MHPRRDGLRDVGEQAPRATDSQVSGKRRIVIITGLSGAGKSNALQAFEDAGYFCIDNLPPRMIPAVMETAAQGNGGPDGVVVVMDIRGRRYFGGSSSGASRPWRGRAVGSVASCLSSRTTGRW